MSLVTRNLVALGDSLARCVILPEAGGAIAGFWWEIHGKRVDWLRPASAGAIAAGAADGMACFPLVPWGNRIRDGRFLFCGREVRLDAPGAHALHGHGWRKAWRVAERSVSQLVLEYRHEPDGWPWEYEARQTIALDGGALVLTLEITNLSDGLMPGGLGFHPNFPMTPSLTLAAATRGV